MASLPRLLLPVTLSVLTVAAACSSSDPADQPGTSDGGGGVDDAASEGGGKDGAGPEAGGNDAASSDAADAADADEPRVFTGCNGALACKRTAFLTKTFYDGNLGGIAGADAKCQAAADASPSASIKGKRFMAWLSDGTTTPAGRFPHGTLEYDRTDGVTVVFSWTDLTDGTLGYPLNMDEDGNNSATMYIWTGVAPNGTAGANDCGHWSTGTSGTGGVGVIGRTDGTWTQDSPIACTTKAALYCFEY